VTCCHSDKLLGKALEEACPLREVIELQPEWEGHAVDHKEADPRVVLQEVVQQLELSKQLHVVMATHLRDARGQQIRIILIC